MRRILVLVLAVLALAACSKQAPEVTANDQVPADQRTEAGSAAGASEGGTEGGGGGSSPTWVAVDINFESAPESLPAGDTEVELVNNGSAVHDVTFEELDETVVTANGGETATGTVSLEAGTTYTYYCSVPGHREGGMEGKLEVQ